MKKTSNRIEEIVRLKNSGLTQQKIAEKYGISRQRVQQIESSLGLDRKKEKILFKHSCSECDKPFESRNSNRKYCSKACSSSGRKIEKTEEYLESIREKKRIRANEYYHRVIKNRKKLDI